MKIAKDELIPVLSQYNPWWHQEAIPDLSSWTRAVFQDLLHWIKYPPAPRALLISGARQIGKTTLLLQAIDALIKEGVPPTDILYATFDHPLIKLAGVDQVLEAWREREPKIGDREYVFLDEGQFIPNWGTWVKHQVDFSKKRRIVFTGSAIPLMTETEESGVGRWHTIRLTTLSFYEYLQLKKVQLPTLPQVKSLKELFSWPQAKFYQTAKLLESYIGHFHEYLVRGGFPQVAQIENIHQAQRLLREDMVNKVLNRDMTALFGIRRVIELEQTFLYLCMHDSSLLDMTNLCANLELKRPTVQNFINALEATHLIYRLPPYGYGKDILRAKYKVYLADPAIASAVLLRGKSVLDDPAKLGIATETAVFKHLYTCYYQLSVRFSYWRGNKNREVDLIAEIGEEIIPFEIKYRAQHTGAADLQGLLELCQTKSIERAYVVTKSLSDFGLIENLPNNCPTRIMKIPAALLCYWMGEHELLQSTSSE